MSITFAQFRCLLYTNVWSECLRYATCPGLTVRLNIIKQISHVFEYWTCFGYALTDRSLLRRHPSHRSSVSTVLKI